MFCCDFHFSFCFVSTKVGIKTIQTNLFLFIFYFGISAYICGVLKKTEMKQLTQQQLEQVYREHPEWRANLEVGKWYHIVGHANFLMCFQGKIGNHSAYGFDLDGKWSYGLGIQEGDQWTAASDSEVAESLIAEARKRGFRAGVEINNAALGFHDGWQKIEHRQIDGDIFSWKGGHLNLGSRCTSIFHNGNWADVREAAATVEVGKWYKLPDNDNFLFCVTELLSAKSAYGYGWCKQGKWHDVDNKHWGCEDVIPATHEEVEAALIAEAKRRYRDGDRIKAGIKGNGSDDFTLTGRIDNCTRFMRNNILILSGGYENDYAAILFREGQWATVVTLASTLAEDIQALRDKYPDYNWTIVAEGK